MVSAKGYITEAHNPVETRPPGDRTITIHTDGACIGNPGPGSWGVVLQSWNAGNHLRTRTLSGGAPETTNNRMELRAAIEGLKALKRKDRPITVFSDSRYVVDGITSWIDGWKAKGWRSSNRKPVKNKDLWRELDTLANDHGSVSWRWVKGHAGDPGNEQADGLANAEPLRLCAEEPF